MSPSPATGDNGRAPVAGGPPSPAAAVTPTGRTRQSGHLSLRLRLTVWVVAVNTLIIWASGSVFWLYQKWSIDESLNQRRIANAQRIAAELRPFAPEDLATRVGGVSSELSRQFVSDQVLVQVRDSRGMVVASSAPAQLEAEEIGIEEVVRTGNPVVSQLREGLRPSTTSRQLSARVVSVPMTADDGRRYVVVFGVSDGFAREQFRVFRGVILIMFIVGPIAAAVSGWFIAGVAVAPFERLRRLASKLMPESSSTSLLDNSLGASTEVVRLAEELDLARARVAERFAAQERFLSNVSHELKTPIAVMLTEAQTIDRSGLSTDAERFVDSVEEEMSKLGRLVESFLTLSRIQDGKGLARFRPYSANDLIMDSMDDCVRMADQHQVRLVPELLAEEDTLDAAVSGEPELLRTMLDNLIRNAVRFSPEGGKVLVRAVVELAGQAERRKPWVLLSVQDEGPGIPPQLLGTIFDRFSQAPNQPRHGRGHGLGLTIAMGIAELHGGSIAAENRSPHGCSFTIALPLRTQQEIGAHAEVPRSGQTDAAH